MDPVSAAASVITLHDATITSIEKTAETSKAIHGFPDRAQHIMLKCACDRITIKYVLELVRQDRTWKKDYDKNEMEEILDHLGEELQKSNVQIGR